MATITFYTISFLLLLGLSAAAPAEKQPIDTKEALITPAEAKEDLVAEKDDLKPAASHWGGGWGGYGGHWGGYGGHWGGYGHYPYWGSSYWGYPSWGYGYGWPYGGYGYGHGGYWW